MEKILILGSTGRGTKELLLEAKKRGIYTIITDYISPNDSPVKLLADEYWMINTNQIDILEQRCREENINGVINGISTFNIGVTMELSKRLGLNCYATPESWYYTIDKRAFKDICIKNSVPVAKDYYVSINPTQEELEKIQFPVVVKAIDQSANRGMSYCNTKEEVIKACEYARSFSKSDVVIVEKMLKGHEYTAWYVMAEGEVELLDFGIMLNQPGYPSNCYSFTVTMADKRDLFMSEMNDNIIKSLKEMGCKEGIAWIEMMMDDDDNHLYALEMGYRMSGDMMCLPLGISHNFNIFSWLVDIAMGVRHSSNDLKKKSLADNKNSYACSYILWSMEGGILSEINGLDEISKIPSINIDSRLRVGDVVGKHQYLSVITFNARDAYDMIDTITKINDHVVYKVENRDIVIRYNNFDTIRFLQSVDKKCLKLI